MNYDTLGRAKELEGLLNVS